MTLILNEIHINKSIQDSVQFAVADRLLTNEKGQYHGHRQKLFPVPHLITCVSYFGLASYRIGSKEYFISDLLSAFIRKSSSISSIPDFAYELRNHLNKTIPVSVRSAARSGFHIAGYDGASLLPHFWHFSNISGMTGVCYNGQVAEYALPTSDFLERDAKINFNWNKETGYIDQNKSQIYRNGDILIHVSISELFDEMMGNILSQKGFKRPKSEYEYADYLIFKFEEIIRIQQKWAITKLIGKPIDIYILKPNSLEIRRKDKWEKINF
jgi:hypothetical protein